MGADTGAEEAAPLVEIVSCGYPRGHARGAGIDPGSVEIESVVIELACRACSFAPEVHPTFLDPEGRVFPDNAFYRTEVLVDAGGSQAVPGQSTNFPCAWQKDESGDLIFEAVTVRIAWDGGTSCVVHTKDQDWWPTLEAETGCELGKVRHTP